MDGVLAGSPELDVFGQMALDEALLVAAPEAFVLRFFRWRGVGATFGYAQRFAEVAAALPPELAGAATRRPTGGGIVEHVGDLTFSCTFPAEGWLRPGEWYRRVHAAVGRELGRTGLAARLCAGPSDAATAARGTGVSRCFAEPVALDLLEADGSKILGGAVRRRGDRVLYQGSLQVPDARVRAEEYREAIARALAAEWGVRWRRAELPAEVRAAAAERSEKYRSAEWIRRR